MAASYTQSDSAKDMYNARASDYDDSWHPAFAQHMVDSLNLKPGEKLLDLACGTGLLTLPAAKKVGSSGRVVGVDVSDGMLAKLQAKRDLNRDLCASVTIIKHDITKLGEIPQLEKGSFDAVSCASALVLLREPGLALQLWAEYLKPGGRLIVDATDKNIFPQGIALENMYRRLNVEPPFHRCWSEDGTSLRQILQKAGLEIDSVWPMATSGADTKYHPASEAEKRFDDMSHGPLNKALIDQGLIEKARALFKEEWERLATHDGKVLEVDHVWIALARKPSFPLEAKGQGSCACGRISWTSYAVAQDSSNCHCTTCRKLSGSPYITFVDFPLSKITFNPQFGKPFIKKFQAHPNAEREFCGECGSTLTMWYRKDPDTIALAEGTIDEEKCVEGFYTGAKKHIYTRSVPSWYKIPDDGLPRQTTMGSEAQFLED